METIGSELSESERNAKSKRMRRKKDDVDLSCSKYFTSLW